MGGRLWVPVPSGPLARYAAGYGSWLAARGYSRWTVAHRLGQLELVSGWLEREELRPEELTAERIDAFLEARSSAGFSSWSSARSMALPLGYLRGLGVVPVAVPVVAGGPLEGSSNLDETKALLAAPDRGNWHGRRDHTLLLVAIQTGLRVSELIALRLSDVSLSTGAHPRAGRGSRRAPGPDPSRLARGLR